VTDETTPKAILVADKSMATGSLDETYNLLDQAMKKGLQEKYDAVVKARAEAKELGTVEAQRERVEAELIFEKYVYELFSLASAAQPPAEGHSH
jgi:3-hydroxyisobutyrate dehydrogenase-like beta-hydroxyacid dehydrogenase